jgi:hypothetical protein
MRTEMKTRFAVGALIALGLFALYYSLSGAPLRVHVASGAGLVVAFWLPSLLVGRPADVWARRWAVLGLVVIGHLVLEILSTGAISKKEFLDSPLVFAVGVPMMIVLLLFHGTLVSLVQRRMRTA